MGEKTNIGWTDSSWNPVTGCSKVSEGCRFCYAETFSLRMGWSDAAWTFPNAERNVKLHPDRLDLPLRWKKPRMVFVNSMSDLFHEQIPDDFIDQVFDTMRWAQQHTFQVLTKRPERMASYVARWAHQHFPVTGMGIAMRHVWFGTSVEDQRAADERIPHLVSTPAAVRFLSCEPLLGPIDLSRWTAMCDHLCPEFLDGEHCRCSTLPPLDWVIVGGESGSHLAKEEHKDRWMRMEWARAIRDQCADIALYFKQQSALRPGQKSYIEEVDGTHTEYHQFPAVR